MKGNIWRRATLEQLTEIAYNDRDAHPVFKWAALEEIRRRRKQKFVIVQYREKAVYR